jgi:putative aldouronate transport system permease protein
MSTVITPSFPKRKKLLLKLIRQRYLYLMLIPSFVLVVLFSYIPLVGWIIAFKNYQIGLNVWHAKWTGMEQFEAFLLQSDDYMYLIRNTLVMNISSIIVLLVGAIVFSILINELKLRWFARIVQTCSFFPFFVSWVIVYSLVYSLFGVSSGAINHTLIQMGLINEGIDILGSPQYSWALVIFMSMWKLLGYDSVIFIAAISSISPEQYEAADIDGANRWQKTIHITLPSLMPTFIVLLIMNSGWILNSNFDLFYLFTGPTNWPRMEVLDMYIYKYGLQLTNYPYATAVGMIKSFVSIGILLIVNALSKKVTGKGML